MTAIRNDQADLGLTKMDGEFLRVIASVSVVTAHCIHYWVEQFYQTRNLASLPFFCTVLDQLTRFTVPLFFFLSGFGLTLQFNRKPIRLMDYYRFRLVKILAPFLAWSAFTGFRHMNYLESLPWRQDFFAAAASLSRFLFLDGFDYQYYFLIVIFQFYVIFPFVYRLGRSKLWLGLFLAVHLLFLSPSETYLQLLGWELPRLHPNLLIFHWFYCFAGVFAASNKDFLMAVVRRWGNARLGGFWLLAGALLNIEFLVNIHNEKFLYDVDHFNRWAVLLYCMATLMVFLKFQGWIRAHFYANPHCKTLFTHFAPYTFFVYLAHTHVLRVVDFLLWEVTVFDMVNRVVLVIAGSYALAWSAQWLLEEFPHMRFLLGLPKNLTFEWEGVPGAQLLRIRNPNPESAYRLSTRRDFRPRARGWRSSRMLNPRPQVFDRQSDSP